MGVKLHLESCFGHVVILSEIHPKYSDCCKHTEQKTGKKIVLESFIIMMQVLIDTAAPLEAGGSGRDRDRDRGDRDRDRERDRDRGEGGILGGMVRGFVDPISAEAFGGYGPMRSYGRLYGSMDYGSVSAKP
jgi:hypothetical protein